MNPALHGRVAAALMACCLASLVTRAAEPAVADEPLWKLAIKQVKKAGALTASKVITQVTVRDGDNVFLGSIESVDVLSGWKQDTCVWANVSKKTVGSPGFTMELSLHIEENPGGILDGYDSWTPHGPTLSDGRPAMLWEGMAAREDAGRVLAYLDPVTARPWRIELTLPVRSTFGTRLVDVTVNFGAGPRDTWVPLGATIDQAGRFMFWKRHLVITKSFQDWSERGSTLLPTGPAP